MCVSCTLKEPNRQQLSCLCIVRGFDEDNFLENLLSVLFCLFKKRFDYLLCVFDIFFRTPAVNFVSDFVCLFCCCCCLFERFTSNSVFCFVLFFVEDAYMHTEFSVLMHEPMVVQNDMTLRLLQCLPHFHLQHAVRSLLTLKIQAVSTIQKLRPKSHRKIIKKKSQCVISMSCELHRVISGRIKKKKKTLKKKGHIFVFHCACLLTKIECNFFVLNKVASFTCNHTKVKQNKGLCMKHKMALYFALVWD